MTRKRVWQLGHVRSQVFTTESQRAGSSQSNRHGDQTGHTSCGVIAKTVDGGPGNPNTVLRFDSSGNVTTDNWSAAGISNYGGDDWLGHSSSGVANYYAAPVELSSSPWYAPDGNGGNTAVQNISVTNFSQSGPNQTTISNVLQKIQAALPSFGSCNSWLVGSGSNSGTTGSSEIQQLVQFNLFGHATLNIDAATDYDTWAFSGVLNPDNSHIVGVPDGIALTVNDVGGFFNGNFPDSPPYYGASHLLDPRDYRGNTLRAQAATLIHEIAHQITVSGFQKDLGKRKVKKVNNKFVVTNCRQLIEGLQ